MVHEVCGLRCVPAFCRSLQKGGGLLMLAAPASPVLHRRCQADPQRTDLLARERDRGEHNNSSVDVASGLLLRAEWRYIAT
jgi:hypothetical protein